MTVLFGLLLLTVTVSCQEQPPPDEPETCFCVPYYQCMDGIVVTDGRGIIDPRGMNLQGSSKEEKFVSSLPRLEGVSQCGPYHVCCLDPDTSGITPYRHKCGNRNPAGTNPWAPPPNGTSPTYFGEWPWQAAILKRTTGDFSFRCGGALIDDRHIITAAQCVHAFTDDKDSLVIRLGEWDTAKRDDLMPHEDYDVQDIFVHDQYNPSNLHNDIAVVKLKKTVQFKSYIDTVCLPADDDDFTGHNCTVTGWGKDKINKGQYSLTMREVTVPIISNTECQGLLRGTRLGPRFKLHSKFLCAGGAAEKDVCKGDGGGALVCYKRDNSYAVAGLVSWGVDCGKEKIPGVYIDVKKFIDFITCKTQRPINEYLRS